MFSTLIRRLARPAAAGRLEVCPPVFLDTEPAWKWGMSRWLRGPIQQEAERYGRVAQVKHEFCQALDGIDSDDAGLLLERVARARSLLELWHLRAEVYHHVSLQHSQDEAERRLALLNRHYPTRSPRSGFAPLDAI